MKVKIKRNTGFFGMGSPLKIVKNGEQVFEMKQNEETEMDIAEEGMTIQAKMSFLQSEPYQLAANQEDETEEEEKEYEIKINPSIFRMYVTFFTFIFIFPLLFRSWGLGVVILLAYIIFVAVMSRKFYTIEEKQ